MLGTGFLGTFTTYSSLAVETDLLIHRSHPAIAVGYILMSLAVGLMADATGIAVAARATQHCRGDGQSW